MIWLVSLGVLTTVFAQGPLHWPTHGEVWPKPRDEKKGSALFTYDSQKLQYKIVGEDCSLLKPAIERTKNSINILEKITNRYRSRMDFFLRSYNQDSLKELRIDLCEPCTPHEYPQFDMSENYTLSVSAVSNLIAPSIWGIIRGLETFSQLFYLSKNYKDVLINSTEITDYPNYKHRGLLLDTARHFITVHNILMTLEAMAMNKMNVFHWHIVDDQSFPYQSEKFPELSGLGAYWPSLIYTRPAMEKIRDHARELGIRVIIEIDMPDHALSWGVSHPEILTVCARDGRPMNPVKNDTYSVVGPLLREVQALFPDTYIHLGGDEVNAECWIQNKGIQEYMEKHNMTSTNDLSAMFYNRIVSFLNQDTRTIVWEESYEANVPLARDSLVQVWKNGRLTAELLNRGRFVLQSASYYLDQLGTTFRDFYKVEPRLSVKAMVANESLLQNLVGGEACMWGEMVDDANVISRVWPRASAVAEVLWSETKGEMTSETLQRAEEHACRMKRRRIHAEPPSGPGFCIL